MALVANTITTANTFAQLAWVIRSAATELNRRQLGTHVANNMTIANGLNVTGNVAIAQTKRVWFDADKDTSIHTSADDTVVVTANGSAAMTIHPNRQVDMTGNQNFPTNTRVVLDADKDTYIVSTTDDKIEFVANGSTAVTIYPNAKLTEFAGNTSLGSGYAFPRLSLDTDKDTGFDVSGTDDLFYLTSNGQVAMWVGNSRVTTDAHDFKVDGAKKFYLDTDDDTFLTSNSVDDTISLYANNQIVKRYHPNKTIETFGPQKMRGQLINLDLDNDTRIDVSTDDRVKFIANGSLRTQIFPNGVLQANVGLRTPMRGHGHLGTRRNLLYNSQFELWHLTSIPELTYAGTWVTGPIGWFGRSNGFAGTLLAGTGQATVPRTGSTFGTIQDTRFAFGGQKDTSSSSSTNELRIRTYVPATETLFNKQCTLSFWAHASTGTPTVSIAVAQFWQTGGGTTSENLPFKKENFTLSITPTRYSTTFTFPTSNTSVGNNTQYYYLDFWMSQGSSFSNYSNVGVQQTGRVSFYQPQLEIGPFATDYQPTWPELHHIRTTIYSSTGNAPVTNRTKAVEVRVQGGGGGGGGCDGQGAGTCSIGGGGGGGGYVSNFYLDLTPTEEPTVTVGLGGAGVVTGTASSGGASQFSHNLTLVTAGGGGGGSGEIAIATNFFSSGGGGGGASGSYNWIVTGGAGHLGVGIAGVRASGSRSGSSFSGGEVGGGPQQGSNGTNGYGGGGGEGASVEDVTTNYTGGDGGDGYVVVAEYGEMF